jgi:hypothetical protein
VVHGGCKEMKTIDNINAAIDLLEESVARLKIESDYYYSKGDNYRGNIRDDAMTSLEETVKRLKTQSSYMTIAFAK